MEHAQALLFPLDLCLFIFAGLVCHAAGCFACRLAGCLAFAAAAMLYAPVQVPCCNRFDSCHILSLLTCILFDKVPQSAL